MNSSTGTGRNLLKAKEDIAKYELKSCSLPEGLEDIIGKLGYHIISEHKGWRIYTKKAEAGNDFTAVHDNDFLVKGNYGGIVLDFVKEDLRTIERMLTNPIKEKGDSFVKFNMFAAALAIVSAYFCERIGLNQLQVAGVALAPIVLVNAYLGIVDSIIPRSKLRKKAKMLSDKAVEYKYGHYAIAEIAEIYSKKDKNL